MIWEKLRGVGEQRDRFRRSIARGRLSHAYLFVGPAGVGKKRFAAALAQCLFCRRFPEAELEACGTCPPCLQMQAGTHPDFHEVGCPEGKRELPIELFAGSLERRGREGLCHDLSLSPMAGERRIAVIDDAHLMTSESANSLLKTLEEPPANSLLILIATTVDGMLPTIRSRCQLVPFAPLPDADVAELLVELEWVGDPAEAAAVSSLCAGSLELARQLLDPALRQLRETLYVGLAAADFDAMQLAGELLEGVEELGGDVPAQRQTAGWLLRFAVEFYRRAAVQLAGAGDASDVPQVRAFCAQLFGEQPEALEIVLRLFDRTTQAVAQLDRNMPVALCLEGLFDELARIERAAAGT